MHFNFAKFVFPAILVGFFVSIGCNSDSSSNPICLELDVDVIGQGTVEIDPIDDCYIPDDTIYLSAIPSEGYEFAYWESDDIVFESGSEYLDEIELYFGRNDITLTANFELAFIVEGEPDCYDDYDDSYNGGCNSTPEVFQAINNDVEIHGKSGHYMFQDTLNYRDTDWYEYEATGDEVLTWTVYAEFNPLLFIIDGRDGCADSLALIDTFSVAYDTLTLEAQVQAGTYWMWVGPDNGDTSSCGTEYTAWFTATTAVAAANKILRCSEKKYFSPLVR